MTSKSTATKLARENFRFVEDETGRFNGLAWAGTIEPIQPIAADGEEITWVRVRGNTRAEMDAHAIREAREIMRHAHLI